MGIKVSNGVHMRKTINKALRVPFMKFYLDNGTNLLTKVKTKKRMKELIKSVQFCNEIREINIDYKNKTTIIIRRYNV